MPAMPFGIAALSCLLLIPLVTSVALSYFLYFMQELQLSPSELQDMLWKVNVVLSTAFILLLPTIIAFWTRHESRWSITWIVLLTGWMVIPYLIALHWSLGGKGPTKPITESVPPPIPQFATYQRRAEYPRQR